MGGILKPTVELPCGTVINILEEPNFHLGDVFVVPPIMRPTPDLDAFHERLRALIDAQPMAEISPPPGGWKDE